MSRRAIVVMYNRRALCKKASMRVGGEKDCRAGWRVV